MCDMSAADPTAAAAAVVVVAAVAISSRWYHTHQRPETQVSQCSVCDCVGVTCVVEGDDDDRD